MASSGTYLNITLPDVGTTLGPTWATQLNSAWQSLDSHDHSSGKGAQVPSAGISINANLSFATAGTSYKATDLESLKFTNNAGTAFTSTAYDNSAFSEGGTGELYYINSDNAKCQITNGTVVNVAGQAAIKYSVLLISDDTTLALSDNYSLYLVNSSTVAITVTLPAASTGTDGRFVIIKDYSGNASTYNIGIRGNGSEQIDGAGTSTTDAYTIASNYGSVIIANYTSGTGNAKWTIV